MTNPQASGDFASIMAEANKMASSAVANPFGAPVAGVVQGGRGQQLPVRQTTEVFCLPKGAPEYDALMNRAWLGEIAIRFEEKTWTKESDFMIAVCWFERRPEPRPFDVAANGDAEPEEKPRKLP